MKRLRVFLYGICILLLCGCGEKPATEARTLPDVRILDETPTPLTETSSPAREAASVPSPKIAATPLAAPSPTASPGPAPIPEPTPDPAVCPYVGSRNSEVYHLAGCSQAARIKAENLVGWESIEAAEAAGRTPCKACFSDKPAKTPKPTETPKPTRTPEPTALPEETVIPIIAPEPTPGQQTEERSIPTEYVYVGSRNSEVYHIVGCSQAERIKAENLVGWENPEEAEAAGRTPCKLCLPDQEDNNAPTDIPQQEETVIPITTPEPTAGPQPDDRIAPNEYTYVGSKKSDKYHLPSCRYAQSIDDENRIGWASREEAEAAGYEACKVCKP